MVSENTFNTCTHTAQVVKSSHLPLFDIHSAHLQRGNRAPFQIYQLTSEEVDPEVGPYLIWRASVGQVQDKDILPSPEEAAASTQQADSLPCVQLARLVIAPAKDVHCPVWYMKGHGATTQFVGSSRPHVGDIDDCTEVERSEIPAGSPALATPMSYSWACVFSPARDTLFFTSSGCHGQRDLVHPNDGIEQMQLSSPKMNLVYRLAGTLKGNMNGLAHSARFDQISALALDERRDRLYIADAANHVIRQLSPISSGHVSVLCGGKNASSGMGIRDGTCEQAMFALPQGLALESEGQLLYVSDNNNHCIRAIHLRSHSVSTVAGMCGVHGYLDGVAHRTLFRHPTKLCYDPDLHILYIADHYNHRIRYLDPFR